MSDELEAIEAELTGEGEVPMFTGADPVTGEPLPGSRVSIADSVFEGTAVNVRPKLTLVEPSGPSFVHEVDPLVRDGIIAAPTVDPKPAEPTKRRLELWGPSVINDKLHLALNSGSPKRRQSATFAMANHIKVLQDVLTELAKQADLSRRAFMRLAEYVGPEATEDALKGDDVAPAPAEQAEPT